MVAGDRNRAVEPASRKAPGAGGNRRSPSLPAKRPSEGRGRPAGSLAKTLGRGPVAGVSVGIDEGQMDRGLVGHARQLHPHVERSRSELKKKRRRLPAGHEPRRSERPRTRPAGICCKQPAGAADCVQPYEQQQWKDSRHLTTPFDAVGGQSSAGSSPLEKPLTPKSSSQDPTRIDGGADVGLPESLSGRHPCRRRTAQLA